MKQKETKCDHSPIKGRTTARDKVKLGEYKKTQDLGIKGFTWRTCNDNQVCDKCFERNGKHYNWGDLSPDELPGMQPGCRCHADPDLDQAFDELFRA